MGATINECCDNCFRVLPKWHGGICPNCGAKIEKQTHELPMPEPTALTTQIGGDHYKSLAIQPAEYCQRNQLRHLESSVVKYVTRHRNKGGEQDIRKAIHCLELLLALEYSPNAQPSDAKGASYGS